MKKNKKDLAKIAVTAFLLAASSPASVSAVSNASEGQGTFLAASCSTCGAKRGQLADNSCSGARRPNGPQSASCSAQRGTIADNSCSGARRPNGPQSASCSAVRDYTADNSTSGNMYNPSTNSYQTGGQAGQQQMGGQNPYGAPQNPNEMNNANRMNNSNRMNNQNGMNNANRMNNSNRMNNPNMQGGNNPNQRPSGGNFSGQDNY